MPSQTVNVFISYSHADTSLVAPVVKLLRVNRSLVFQDIDRIPPGKKWRDEIAKALAESNLVVVFWCDHAYRSTEVSTEWKAAIEQEKDLLPLLLDATPLPSELGQFQWIDFRGTVGPNHSSLDSRADDVPPPMMARSRRGVSYALAGLTVAAAVGFGIWVSLSPMAPNSPEPTDVAVPALPPPSPAPSVVPIGWILVLLGVVGALSAYLLWLRHRRTKRERRIETAKAQPGQVERRMAVELEAEILRRTASAQDSGV